MTNLSGLSAFVTGGTRGIGRAIAEALAAAGAKVTVNGRGPATHAPDGCDYVQADFAEQTSLKKFAAELRHMSPDILVNNAGVNKIGSAVDFPMDDFAAIQEVNVTAPFVLCQAVLPGMIERKWGRIVNMASVWGKIGKELRAPYSASKFALVGLSSAIAAEVTKFGVLVNCVSPGPIETEMTRSVLNPQMLEDLLKSVPAGRLGTPAEVANLVLWLAGRENTFVSGQNIAIDGGMTRA